MATPEEENEKNGLAWLEYTLTNAWNKASKVMNDRRKPVVEQAVPAAFAAIRHIQDEIEKLVDKSMKSAQKELKALWEKNP